MKPINYNAQASLWKDVLGQTSRGLRALYKQEIVEGTLRYCLAEFDAKPECKKGLYSVITDDNANLPKTTLFRSDIEALRRAA